MDNVGDANVRTIRDGILNAIRQLQSDQRDYGGHRADAVSDLQRAEAELDRALAFDREHPVQNPGNANIEAIINGLNTAEMQLKSDQRDYSGHRASALEDVQRAVRELQAALSYDRTH